MEPLPVAMLPIPNRKRPLCPLCARAQSSCICHWVRPVEQPTEVLILQHPLEAQHAKNSAGLLQRSVSNSRLLVGEVFGEATLRVAMQAPRYTLLLYPESEHVGHATPAPLDAARRSDPSALRLIVLDGTWRKSRKMLHLSPLLQSLPRLALQDTPASLYAIRKAHKPGQLSTLEATCAALAQLQGDGARYQALLQAFQGFVAQQASYVRSQASVAAPGL